MYSVLRTITLQLQELKKRQEVVQNQDSFFTRITHIIKKYNLPGSDEMNQSSMERCKYMVKKSIRNYWTKELTELL